MDPTMIYYWNQKEIQYPHERSVNVLKENKIRKEMHNMTNFQHLNVPKEKEFVVGLEFFDFNTDKPWEIDLHCIETQQIERMVIDTGSNLNIMDTQTFNRIKKKIIAEKIVQNFDLPRSITIYGVNSQPQTSTRCLLLNVQNEERILPLKFICAPTSPCKLLLGRDAINKLNITFIRKPTKFFFMNLGRKLELNIMGSDNINYPKINKQYGVYPIQQHRHMETLTALDQIPDYLHLNGLDVQKEKFKQILQNQPEI